MSEGAVIFTTLSSRRFCLILIRTQERDFTTSLADPSYPRIEAMNPNANWFSIIALGSWPIVALWLFNSQPLNRAIVVIILYGQLLLPVGTAIKFEGIPAFDKVSVGNLSALIGCIFLARRSLRLWRQFGLVEVLMLAFVLSPFVTCVLNKDPIFVGDRTFPAETFYDGLSAVVSQIIYLTPFLLGRRFLRQVQDTEVMLRSLAVAGLLYSLPMLLEVRLAPQLHIWIYGFFPHTFSDQFRGGAFRPVVFLGHGLIVAFFSMTTLVAASVFWRMGRRVVPLSPGGVTAYLSVMLVLCRSLGSLLYGAILVPLVRFATPRLQLRIAVILAAIALCYPVLRLADLVPTNFVLGIVNRVDVERARSLETRFIQERRLLDRAAERFWFGWGRWSRSRVRDDDTGKDVSTTDGLWVITMGTFGFCGYLALFGLLALPVFRAAAALRSARSPPESLFLAALGLIAAITLFEQLPNSYLSPWAWLGAGALLGRVEMLNTVRRALPIQTQIGGNALPKERTPAQP